jgi:hypothetical protein
MPRYFWPLGPVTCKRPAKIASLAASAAYRSIRSILRWVGRLLLLFIVLIIGIVFLLLIPSVQTWVAGELAVRISRDLGAEVRIGRVSLNPLGPLTLEDIHINDLRGDTLITVGSLNIHGLRIHNDDNIVQASSVTLENARFALATAEDDIHSNLTNLLKKLASEDTTSTEEKWTVRIGEVLVDEFHFSYVNANEDRMPYGVDFDHVDVRHAHVAGRQFFMQGDSIAMEMEELSFQEHSGLHLVRLSGSTVVRPRGIDIANMELVTPNTNLRGQLKFTNDSWAAYDDFEQAVTMRIDLDSSRLDFADISYFAPDLQGMGLPIALKGKIRGTVSELRGRDLSIGLGENSWFRGSADLSGLPDVPNTFMLVDVTELSIDPNDLATIPTAPFTEGGRLAVPAEVHQLGRLEFEGNFTGFTRAFTAYGRSRTSLGELRTDLSYERDTLTNIFTLSGRAATGSFDIGPLLKTSSVGPLAANIRIKGRGTTIPGMRADLEGTFPFFTFEGRRITGITANGRLERDLFNGALQVQDENLVMDFRGLADMRGRWPLVDFAAQVQHLDLKALGLAPKEEYSTLSVLVNVEGRLSPDSLLGRLEAKSISYCNENGEHDLGDITIRSGRTQGQNVLELDADVADATITGTFLPTRAGDAVMNVIYSIFPSLQEEVEYQQAEQRFRFELYPKNTKAVLDLFVPGLEVDSGAVITGSLDSRTFDIDLTGVLPGIRYKDLHVQDVQLIADKTLDVMAFGFKSARQTWQDSVWFSGMSITGKAYQDEVDLEMGWDGSSSGTNGELTVLGEVRSMNSFALDLLPSRLHFGRGNWENREAIHMEIDSSTVRIDSLVMYNEGQQVAINGTISRDASKAVAVHFHHFELENLKPLIGSLDLTGDLTGSARVFDIYQAPVVNGDLLVDSVHIAGHEIGRIRFLADWAQGQKSISLKGDIDRREVKILDFDGRMQLDTTRSVDVALAMDRFDLTVIDPYLPTGLSDVQGFVSGVVNVSGTVSDPQVNGELQMVNAGVRIDYLNTLYTFDHEIMIRPDMFRFDQVTLRDEEGNTAIINGAINHDGFKDLNYDISGTMNGLMVLNTTLLQNDIFYGKAYGIGDVSVSGYGSRIEIVADARTADGTDIHFPVGGSLEVSDIGFIRFLSSDTALTDERAVDLSGVTLDMKVEVTPEAHFELIFDPTVGDILSGRGRGNMEMTVSPTGEFAMRGQVEISDGDYLFTLKNVVNKRFQLEPGGRIVWYGDPFDAQIDLHANYRLRAPLYDIMYEKNDAYRRRVPVDVVMHLRDKLMNPEINFEVRLPSVDEAIRTQVNSVLSTEQELNQQVFSLIVLNRFLPSQTRGADQENGGTGGLATAGASATGWELMSNQVSNWLSQISDDFDLGVNYRQGNNITQDELEVAVSTQLFSERLLFSANAGMAYGQRTTQANNALIGDFQIEYLLTQDGKLRLKGFSQSNDRNLNRADQALTTQGAGVAYREEFDTFGEFWQRVLNIFRGREKDKQFDN